MGATNCIAGEEIAERKILLSLPFHSHGIGFISAWRDWGTIEKCPHCQKTNIKRKAKNQITCGGITCQLKQNNKTKKSHIP